MRKRHVFPRDEFTLVSPKPKADALRILQSRTGIPEDKLLWRLPKDKVFVGTFAGDGFTLIMRHSYGRKPLLLTIHGRVTDTDNGCAVAVRMTPQLVSSAFVIALIASCGLMMCAIAWSPGQTPFGPGVFVPLLLMVSSFGMFLWGFWYAAKQARQKLMKLLRAVESKKVGTKGSCRASYKNRGGLTP